MQPIWRMREFRSVPVYAGCPMIMLPKAAPAVSDRMTFRTAEAAFPANTLPEIRTSEAQVPCGKIPRDCQKEPIPHPPNFRETHECAPTKGTARPWRSNSLSGGRLASPSHYGILRTRGGCRYCPRRRRRAALRRPKSASRIINIVKFMRALIDSRNLTCNPPRLRP